VITRKSKINEGPRMRIPVGFDVIRIYNIFLSPEQ
jgi:hypothetical protein